MRHILVAPNSSFGLSGGGDWRTTRLDGVGAGGGNLTINGDGSQTRFILNADTSTHTGNWIVNGLIEL